MTREEQIEVATATYINGRLRNNVPPEEIEEIRLAYQAGAIYADEHPNNPYKDVIAHMSSNTYRVWEEKFTVGEISKHYNDGYTDGYKDAVNKACEWLKNNHVEIFLRYLRGHDSEDEVEHFKKYMEEKQ